MIRPFTLSDFEKIDVNDLQRELLNPNAIQALCVHSIGWTLEVDGQVLAIAGMLKLWDGVYEVWLFASQNINRHSIMFARAVKQNLRKILKESPEIHRLQTHSAAEDIYDRWMTYLGFEYEGYHPMYSVAKQDFKSWGLLNGR